MKNLLKKKKKEFLAEVANTFMRVPPSPLVCAMLSCCSSYDIETVESAKLFYNKNWWEVDTSDIDSFYPDPFFIGDTPLHYYIPAFLITAVNKECLPNHLSDRLIDYFSPPKKTELKINFERKFALYTYREKKVVTAFMEYIISVCRHRPDEINKRIVRRTSDVIISLSGGHR
jgi:hypothetical protein